MVFTKTKPRKTFRKVTGKSDKHIMAVAKKAIMQEAETKSQMVYHTSSALLDNNTYASNLLVGLSQGITSETYIGEKIHLLNIRFKGFLLNTTSTSNTKFFRMTVVRTKKALVNTTNFGFITSTDVYRSPGSGLFIPCMHVDLHKVDLLYDKTHVLQPSIAAGNHQVPYDFKVKINRKETWDVDNSGFLKNKNYYLVVTGYDSAGITYPITIVEHYAINYKDE